jgi:hypothetical protein
MTNLERNLCDLRQVYLRLGTETVRECTLALCRNVTKILHKYICIALRKEKERVKSATNKRERMTYLEFVITLALEH